MSRFLARFYLGVANGTFRILGFWKILVRSRNLGGFVSCLEISFDRCFFCLGFSDFFPQGLGVSDTFIEHLEISEFCLINSRIHLKDVVFGYQNIYTDK